MNKQQLAVLLTLAALWGGSFLLIKIGVAEMPIAIMAFLSGLVILVGLRVTGGTLQLSIPLWLALTAALPERFDQLFVLSNNRYGYRSIERARRVLGYSLAGALTYAELGAMFPRAGGQYVYLREAFGHLVGFLYGWTLFVVIQTGTIAAVAVAFVITRLDRLLDEFALQHRRGTAVRGRRRAPAARPSAR